MHEPNNGALLGGTFDAFVSGPPAAEAQGGVEPRGFFTFECRNPDGTLAWKEDVVFNGVTNAGLNDILQVYFNAGTQKTTWYLGLIDNAGFTGLAAADTMASHSGWTESTAYSQATRPAWTSAAASGGSITSSSATTFTANAGVTIKGAFLTSDNTKGGTAGLMWATGAFASTQTLTNGQTLSVTYTCPLTAT